MGAGGNVSMCRTGVGACALACGVGAGVGAGVGGDDHAVVAGDVVVTAAEAGGVGWLSFCTSAFQENAVGA